MKENQSLIVRTNLDSYTFSITPGGLLLSISDQIIFLIDKESAQQYGKEAHNLKQKEFGFFPDADYYELKHNNFGIIMKPDNAETLISMINQNHWADL